MWDWKGLGSAARHTIQRCEFGSGCVKTSDDQSRFLAEFRSVPNDNHFSRFLAAAEPVQNNISFPRGRGYNALDFYGAHSRQ
jgi:hypothetical protein